MTSLELIQKTAAIRCPECGAERSCIGWRCGDKVPEMYSISCASGHRFEAPTAEKVLELWGKREGDGED